MTTLQIWQLTAMIVAVLGAFIMVVMEAIEAMRYALRLIDFVDTLQPTPWLIQIFLIRFFLAMVATTFKFELSSLAAYITSVLITGVVQVFILIFIKKITDRDFSRAFLQRIRDLGKRTEPHDREVVADFIRILQDEENPHQGE